MRKKSLFKHVAAAVFAVIAGAFAFLGVNEIVTANAESSALGENLITGGDFENATGSLPDGWSYWLADNSGGTYTGVKSGNAYIVSGEESYSGHSLKAVNESGSDVIRLAVNNTPFGVKGGKTYIFSFMYNSTSDVAEMLVCLRQYRAKVGNEYRPVTKGGADNSYLWLESTITSGVTGKWKTVSAVVKPDSAARYMMLQIDLKPTTGGAAYFDDFSMTEVDLSVANNGFERTAGVDTLVGWVASETGTYEFSDEIYFDGQSSLHIQRNDLRSAFSIDSLSQFSVVSAKTYNIGVYVRSKNSDNIKATVTAVVYNRYGGTVKSFTSAYVFLNKGDELSDWSRVYMPLTMPSNSYTLSIRFTLSAGVADCYVDHAFCEDATSVVYRQDFESVSSDGTIEKVDFGTAGVSGGKLVFSANAYASIELETLLYAYGYTFTGKCEATNGGKPEMYIEWLDFHGKKISETKVVCNMTGDEFTAEFIAAQGTTARLVIKNAGSGELAFDDFVIERTYNPNYDKDGWQAYWVSYPFDDIAYGGADTTMYYRYTFELTENVKSAQIQVTGDDVITSFVNGQELEDPGKNAWASILVTEIGGMLKKGKNVLAFKIYNNTYYGGLLFDIDLTLESGKTMRIYSDDDVVSSLKETNGWKDADFNDGTWSKVYVIGKPPVMPWGDVVYKKNAELLPSVSISDVTVTSKVTSGERFEFSFNVTPEAAITSNITMRVNLRDKYEADENETMEIWIIPELIEGKKPTEWVAGQKNFVKYSVICPDYLVAGSYMLQFDTDEFIITDVEYGNNMIRGEYIKVSAGDTEITESKVAKVGDKVQLLLNGERVAPMMYLREQNTVFKTEYASGMGGAGVQLFCLPNCRNYNMNNDGSMWLGENKYDFSALDNVVYETLQGSPTAKLMLMLDADPPSWWLRKNPDAYAVDSTGKKVGISYASEKWRKDVGEFYKACIAYVLKQPYAGHIFAVKISAGATFEWQYAGVTLNECADFGTAAKAAFKKWLQEKYVTADALRAAWDNTVVTFETASIPTFEERKALTYNTLLDGKKQRNVIDFHEFQNDMVTDSILYLSEAVKTACNNKWIVGTYTGYTTHGQTYESNGLANASFHRLLASEYIDFFCSPICYDERLLSMSGSYMMMVDSVIAAGKLPIIECDSRTVYYENNQNPALLGEWGKTYTLKDSIEALKRDFVNMMIKGAGLWWYDMYGGWFNDPEIYAMIKTAQKEWTLAVNNQAKSTSKIAFVANDSLAPALAYNFNGTYDYLYTSMYQQKESLAHIGAPHDMILTSDIVDGLDRDYDVFIILAINLTKEEIAAIDKYVCVGGKTVIWVGFPGIYGEDGSMSAENVSRLTGFNLAVAKSATYAITMNGKSAMTQGLDGKVYGKITSSAVSPMLYVNDEDAETLGYLYNSNMVGLAAKAIVKADGEAYLSVYSSVGNIPSEFLMNILRGYGNNLIEDKNDVIFRNENYIALASVYGGERTIKLDKKCDVYDVFRGEYVAKGVTEFTVELKEGTTTLFRVGDYKDEEPVKPDDGKDSSFPTRGCGSCNSAVLVSLPVVAAILIGFAVFVIIKKKSRNKNDVA